MKITQKINSLLSSVLVSSSVLWPGLSRFGRHRPKAIAVDRRHWLGGDMCRQSHGGKNRGCATLQRQSAYFTARTLLGEIGHSPR